MIFDEVFDVIVIGAGHAGCEAASAAARIGAESALVTINLDLIGQMSCNPAIGGIAKGHLVREIDALGGIMGRVIDRTGIQFRLLNRSRGPAVQSPRAQADRSLYRLEMRRVLESTPNLHFRQGVVTELIVEKNKIIGVELQDTRKIAAKAVVLAAGTFLNGLIHTGQNSYSAGRSGEPAAIDLAENLKRLGFPVGRLKTGTPPRLDARTIDWDAFEEQAPDNDFVAFSFSTEKIEQPQIVCHIGYTNERLHAEIRENLYQSPLYSGKIKGIGPRYCPSIEDKVVKFADKNRHQLFLEPEGHNTNEVYLNGFSTSLPAELQQKLLKLINGFESVKIIRPGYAIEYDFVDPRQLKPTLETGSIGGLYFAGQINGTTGYEEAACQGLLAGINAALSVKGHSSVILKRESSYIGVLINDLIRYGVDEPYRIFTSRAENRLILRHDNADARLSPIGKKIGLLSDRDWTRYNHRQEKISDLKNVLNTLRLSASDASYAYISQLLNCNLGNSILFSMLAQRQGINPELMFKILPSHVSSQITVGDLKTAMADLLYNNYIKSHCLANERVNNTNNLKISSQINFRRVDGLSNEMVERLERSRPTTFEQIKSIPGMTNAALSTLLVYISSRDK